MSNHTFVHVSLFDRADAPRQLKALCDYVMEPGVPLQVDLDMFEDRLQRYARKAGITLEQAKANVRITCGNALSSRMVEFNLGG